MDELLETFLAAQRAFGARVHAITEEQWSAATPDTEWTVADLVGHLVDEQRWASPLLHGLDSASAADVVAGTRDLPVDGGVGANFAESWDEAVAASADAALAPGALDREVALSRGSTPARDYLLEMTMDLIVHAWDLGAAIGYPEALPDELGDFGWRQAQQWGDVSGTGMFGPPVPVPDDARAIDRLVAAAGRDPGWRAP